MVGIFLSNTLGNCFYLIAHKAKNFLYLLVTRSLTYLKKAPMGGAFFVGGLYHVAPYIKINCRRVCILQSSQTRMPVWLYFPKKVPKSPK